MKNFMFAIVLGCPFFLLLFSDIVAGIYFDREVSGYLKRAANANTVESAKHELDIAIKGIEKRRCTNGTTAVLWTTPEYDIEFWYTNLKDASEELGRVTSETSALERSNLLLKLKETLTDHHEKGVVVTAPPGIDIYPYNTLYFIMYVVTIVMLAVATILLKCATDER